MSGELLEKLYIFKETLCTCFIFFFTYGRQSFSVFIRQKIEIHSLYSKYRGRGVAFTELMFLYYHCCWLKNNRKWMPLELMSCELLQKLCIFKEMNSNHCCWWGQIFFQLYTIETFNFFCEIKDQGQRSCMGVAGGGQIHLQRPSSNWTLCPLGHRFTFKGIFVEE